MNPRKTLRSIEAGSLDVRFADLCGLATAFGFRLARVSGSHHIFTRPGVPELLNLQDVGGRAKPYQVRQFMSLIARYSLKMEVR
ncbi:MAG: type II toxin-antitoxin system HicA family toxin [Coriobacteriia bacterium]|nr:type II toxin-antitoxin system HicA family toxin [Coriobacteriia bacterium]